MKRVLLYSVAALCVLSLGSCAMAQNMLGAGARTLQSATRVVTG